MVNGAECYVRGIEDNPSNVNFPKCIWIEFTDIKIGKNLCKTLNYQFPSKIPKTSNSIEFNQKIICSKM